MLPLLMMLPEPWRVLHAQHHAAHQRRHRGVEARNLQALDAAGLCRAAGIVEQAVDAAEFPDRLADQRAHLVLDGNIGLAEDAVGTELFGQCLALRRAPSGDDDLCAFGDENLRSAQPDAAGRAGDDRDLAVQPSHVVLLVWAMMALIISPAVRNNASHALLRPGVSACQHIALCGLGARGFALCLACLILDSQIG